jgi:hypothetical protein
MDSSISSALEDHTLIDIETFTRNGIKSKHQLEAKAYEA